MIEIKFFCDILRSIEVLILLSDFEGIGIGLAFLASFESATDETGINSSR
jgi:hypothetical protein